MNVFFYAKQKSVINELDVEQRMVSFPVEWFQTVKWKISSLDSNFYDNSLKQIADDFFLGKDYSLGKNKLAIEKAKPLQ